MEEEVKFYSHHQPFLFRIDNIQAREKQTKKPKTAKPPQLRLDL